MSAKNHLVFSANSYLEPSCEPSLEYLNAANALQRKKRDSRLTNSRSTSSICEFCLGAICSTCVCRRHDLSDCVIPEDMDGFVNHDGQQQDIYTFDEYGDDALDGAEVRNSIDSEEENNGDVGDRTGSSTKGGVLTTPRFLPAIEDGAVSPAQPSPSDYLPVYVPLARARTRPLDRAASSSDKGIAQTKPLPKESIRTISPMLKGGRKLKPLTGRNSYLNEHASGKSNSTKPKTRRSSMPSLDHNKKLGPKAPQRRLSGGNPPVLASRTRCDSLDNSIVSSNGSSEASQEDLSKALCMKPILKQSTSSSSICSETDSVKKANLRVTFSDDLEVISQSGRRASIAEENRFLRDNANSNGDVPAGEKGVWFEKVEARARRRRCSLPPLPTASAVAMQARESDSEGEGSDDESDDRAGGGDNVVCSVVHSFTPRPKPKAKVAQFEVGGNEAQSSSAPIDGPSTPRLIASEPEHKNPVVTDSREDAAPGVSASLFDISDIKCKFGNPSWS